MQKYKLRDTGHGTPGITLPRDDLSDDGLLDDGEIPDEQWMRIDRLGERTYLVRACDGDLPDVRESEVVRRLVAETVMDMSAFDSLQPAN